LQLAADTERDSSRAVAMDGGRIFYVGGQSGGKAEGLGGKEK